MSDKHPVGRPLKFETPEELDSKVDEYFEWIKGERNPEKPTGELKQPSIGYYVREPIDPTITGLTLFLGFSDRQSFRDYGERDKFSCSIKRAHCRIEQCYEENLRGNNVAGPIFALKNLGWKDKTEQDLHVTGEQPLFGPRNAEDRLTYKSAIDSDHLTGKTKIS